jgi:murein DD-endopeptidase MepM/ murein hydrolase activator NlpD
MVPVPARRRVRALVATAAAVAVAVTLAPVTAGAQDLQQQLEQVQEDRAALEGRIDDAATRLEEIESRLATREEELARLDARRDELTAQLAATRDAIDDRARAAFKRGGDLARMEALLSGDGPADAIDRVAMLDALARRDASSIEAATALRIQLAQTLELRRQAQEDLEALRGEVEATSDELLAELDQVKALERDVEARAGRQIQVSRGAQQGTYACMMARPYSYIDSWGFARSGGRRHQGTDVMAPFGTEVYAFTNGRISSLSTNRLGGTVLYLWGDDGVRYYYAHLQGYAAGTFVGKRVQAGQLIAYNGNSGNARGGAPHVHFEVHPGGGSAVNPYPWLLEVCRG